MKLLLTFKESHCLGVRVGTLSLLNGSPGNVDGSDEHARVDQEDCSHWTSKRPDQPRFEGQPALPLSTKETKINFWKKNLFHFLNHYCVLNNLC